MPNYIDNIKWNEPLLMYVIYCLRNLINGKRYVGYTKRLKARMAQHRYHAKHGGQSPINLAIAKYGFENFELQILETSDVDLIDNENSYIEKFNSMVPSGYNARPGGMSPVKPKGRRHSDETKAKISTALRGLKRTSAQRSAQSEARKGAGNPRFGAVWDHDQRAAISKRTSGPLNPMYGKKTSPEALRKLSEKLSGRKNPMYGTTWKFINNSVVNKRVKPEHLEDFLKQGWVRGLIR